MKYLGVIINYINLIVSRKVGIATKLMHLLPALILRNIYFALIQSYLKNGIFVWAATFNSYVSPFITQQNEALKVLARVANSYNAQSLYKSKIILPINKIFDLETAKLMFKYYNHQLPLILKNFF